MRIAYMLTSLGIGGAERQVVALAERMQARGHQVLLIVLRPRQRREWQTHVEIVRLNMTRSPRDFVSGLIRGHHTLREFRPKIVHSHTFPANMVARMLRLAGSAPMVLSTIHNVYEGGWRRTLAYRLSDTLSVHTTAVSEAVADRYCRIGAVRDRKCSVIRNGIDTDVFAPLPARSSVAGATKQAEKQFIWCSAGRDVPAKDFDNLLAAFRQVRVEFPSCELRIAGEISDARLKRIQGQDAEARCCEADGVRWLGVCDDVRSVLSSADAFVLSSAWEGMPLAVGEAMAMEKPVIATDAGGVRELVGDCGSVVPPKDPRALAQGMLRVMRFSEEDRAAMGRLARERICHRFDMNATADEWEALYSQLLSDGGQGREKLCVLPL